MRFTTLPCCLALASLLTAAPAAYGEPTAVVPTTQFLDSIGVNTTFPNRGQPLERTIEMIRHCGFRWVRGGIEGLSDDGPTTLQTYLDLHEATGVRFSWGLVSGGTDIEKLLRTARPLADAGALLAFEGNNEPNNWGVTYQGERGGGDAPTWLPVAKLQRDMYAAVKADPQLRDYPVWTISEAGAQRDNVGLQFLTIPPGANTLLPAGTQFADAANCHNYFYHPASPVPADNKVWNAADPSPECRVDGLYGNHGLTWAKKFPGYDQHQLDALPRVTTETGTTIGGAISEQRHALDLLNLFLAQFKRGWSHTCVYLLRDRTDEGGNQQFGYYDRDYQPRLAAEYLHNLTTILADDGNAAGAQGATAKLDYRLIDPPETVHDLLLVRSDGVLQLVVWGERLEGVDRVTLELAAPAAVTIYNPTQGVAALETHTHVRSVALELSDHPLILELDARRD